MPRKSSVSDKKIIRYGVFLVGLIAILAIRIAWVQVVEGKFWTEKARDQLQENRVLQTPRGTIYDRNGRELAVSVMAKSLYANPKELNADPANVAELLSPILKRSSKELTELLSLKKDFIWLKRTLESAEYQSVAALIKDHKLKGLDFTEESRRYYPNESLAAHILGFVGTDDVGLDGIEMTFDKTIKGEVRDQVVDTDSKGVPIFKSIFAFTKPKAGRSLYLTIDSKIQFMVEQSLDKAMARTRAQAATVILMNPHNGEILAMASRPGYNPNQFYRFKDRDWKNRAISIIYEPGSTFKAIVTAVALQEKVVKSTDMFNDVGYVEVGGRRIKNWDGGSYGKMPFSDIVKYSINTGFAQVAMKLGGEKLTSYAMNFGFGKTTGIELPGEEEGMLLNPKTMQVADVATMGIGQSIAVTPIQLLTAVASLANDGQLVKPHVIKEIRDSDGLLVSYTPTQPSRQTVTAATAREVTSLLEKVVSDGGGKKAQIAGYRFAGKTGTAERLRDSGGGYEPGHYIASFIGFGPLEDIQLVGLVIIDNPTGLYYGGEIAAPVFSEIMTQVVRYMGIRPQGSSGIAGAPVKTDKPALPAPAAQQLQPQPAALPPPKVLPPGQITVPNLTGKTMRQAAEMLKQAGFSFAPSGSGVAVRQSIPPNMPAQRGSEIIVYFEQR